MSFVSRTVEWSVTTGPHTISNLHLTHVRLDGLGSQPLCPFSGVKSCLCFNIDFVLQQQCYDGIMATCIINMSVSNFNATMPGDIGTNSCPSQRRQAVDITFIDNLTQSLRIQIEQQGSHPFRDAEPRGLVLIV